MIRSMTGYGRAVSKGEIVQVVVEVSSVNRKNLDVSISLPKDWQRLEPEVTESVKRHVQRGRINVSITSEAAGGGEASFFNPTEVEAALRELAGLCEKHRIPFEPDSRLLFSIASSTRSKPAAAEVDSISAGLLEALEKALVEMVAMRAKEGEALQQDLAGRKGELEKALQSIRAAGGGVVSDYRETLLKRLRQSGLEFALDDERVLKEITLFADRSDISEELTRLESHFRQFDEFLGQGEPVGRKLEFLLQEIGREFNTVGSKASDSAISRLVIDCKNELERIREQVQNVE